MKVCTLDVSKGTTKGKQKPKWNRNCSDICYIQNKYTNDGCPNGLYSIQFTYEFQPGEKDVYFAHSIPYTYSMLNDYLKETKVKRHLLCHSLAGNKVEYLHITNKPSKEAPHDEEKKGKGNEK
jgi:hypothetical protein